MIVPLAGVGRADLAAVGGKAANLGELVRAGFGVPPGFVVTTDAYKDFVSRHGIADDITRLRSESDPTAAERIAELFQNRAVDGSLRDTLVDAYRSLAGDAGPVAVRSSATSEDLADASFAGQQETFLNVRGPEHLLEAVRDCWASLWTDRAMAYRRRQGVDESALALAVVVQQLVDGDAAGVMFTANPANGRREETVISAAWGLGESVVGGGVDTDDLVVDTAAGTLRSRHTADKAVMTVLTDRGTAERPVPAEQALRAVLTDAEALDLARLGARVEEHFGAPQDIEWVRKDGHLLLVQSRPVTSLPAPVGPVPTDWSVPRDGSWYFRASIVEQLPDPLTPLFADLVNGSVTRSLRRLMGELLGPNAVRDGDVSLPTIHGYAYYRYSRAGMIRATLQTPRALPVLATSGRQSGLSRWQDVARPGYRAVVARWRTRPPAELSSTALLDGVVELLDAGTEYYTAVQTIIPQAASSEMIFTRYYDRLVRRDGDPSAATFLLGFDSTPIQAEKSLWGLASWAGADRRLAGWLRAEPAGQIVAAFRRRLTPPGVSPEQWTAWCDRFQSHLDEFGHAVYNLDFANPVPADEPEPVIETLRFYLGDAATDPYRRQGRLIAERERATARVRNRLGGLRRRGFDRLLAWAQAVGPAREDALADVGLAWPVLRQLLRELGDRLTVRPARWPSPPTCSGSTAGEIETALAGRNRRPVGAGRRTADHLARSAPRKPTADAAGRVLEPTVRTADAGRLARPDRGHPHRHRREPGPGDRSGPGAGRTRRLRTDAPRRRAGGGHHHPGLDHPLRDGGRGGHRRRRTTQPQLDRRPRVPDPGRPRHRGRDAQDRRRPADRGGRRRRYGHAARHGR